MAEYVIGTYGNITIDHRMFDEDPEKTPFPNITSGSTSPTSASYMHNVLQKEHVVDGKTYTWVDLVFFRVYTISGSKAEAYKYAVSKELKDIICELAKEYITVAPEPSIEAGNNSDGTTPYLSFRSIPMECDYEGRTVPYTGMKLRKQKNVTQYFYITYFTVSGIEPFALEKTRIDDYVEFPEEEPE